jgi:uncharacterized membrane protein
MAETIFEFGIRNHLKRAWRLFTADLWFYVGISAVMVALNLLFNTSDKLIFKIIFAAGSLVWSYVSISCVLASVDGRQDMVAFDAIKRHLPSMREFLKFIGVIFGSAIIIGVGLILLVIPGIYFAVRLMFANFALVDRKEGVTQSMRFSWHMIKKDIFWTCLLCFVVATALIIIGIAIAGIGVLVTYPIALLFLAMLYRELMAFQHTNVVPQPQEIPETV